MARKLPAKRARRANPREERNRRRSPVAQHAADIAAKVAYVAKTDAQENYIKALEDARKVIVIATGPAGTGKSYLATMFAIRGLLAGEFKKIIITRPTVSAGEDIGFLPGDVLAKLTPWSVPILDIFKEVFPLSALARMLKNEVVEIAPLGMMRGRTLKHAIIICDEMQNSLIAQMRMLLTRIGEHSRMIVTGDMQQHDRGFEENGLKDFLTRLRRTTSSRIAVCEFDLADVERHPVIEEVLSIYGEL